MKWYKHFTDSLSDPFIEELMDNYSHAGYVAWFGLIEIIAKENGHELTGNLEISPSYLKRKLRISQTKLRQIFDFCSTNGKLLFDYSEEKWKFTFPKIAELKDNYTKDLQVTNKKPSKHKEVEVEVEEDKKKIKIKTGGSKRFSPPSIEEVKDYCFERKNSVDPETWINHYQSKGWMIGKNKMKDWKAAVRTWESKGGDNGKGRAVHSNHRETSADRAADQLRRLQEEYSNAGDDSKDVSRL